MNLDKIVDFHIGLGMEPLFELSFMPSWLANDTSEVEPLGSSGAAAPPRCAPPAARPRRAPTPPRLPALPPAPQTVTFYKGISSPPKNYSAWGQLIGRVGAHLAARYPGRAFMFEVWNEPNIQFFTPDAKDHLPAYLHLYREAAAALRAASPRFLVGGPASAGCPSWIPELVAFANATETPLDFVSCPWPRG